MMRNKILALTLVFGIQSFFGIGRRIRRARSKCEELESVLESIRDGFFSVDRDWRLQYVNHEALRLLGSGKRRDEIVGRKIWEEIPVSLAAAFHEEFYRAMQQREEISFECCDSDTRSWYQIHLYPTKAGLSILYEDITGRKAVEESLRRSEGQFQALVETGIIGIVQFELDGRVSSANEEFLRIIGRSQTELEAGELRWRALTPPEFRSAQDRALVALREKGAIGPFETQFLRPDQRRIWVMVAGAAVRSKEGRLIAYVLDIDQWRRDQRERDELLRETQAAVLARDEFLAVSSHELRKPLTSIYLQVQFLQRLLRGHFEYLQEKGWWDEKIQGTKNSITPICERTSTQGLRLANSLDNLLDFTRIRMNRLELEREKLDLGVMVQSAVDRIQPLAEQAGSKIELARDDSVIGYWDRIRVEQIFTHLLSNAVKYGLGKPIEVAVRRNSALGLAVLEVRDHGIGIAADRQARIFGPFETDMPVRKGGGLGLGLFLSKKIIEKHGGAIHFQSVEGEGSLFTVTLPLAEAATRPKEAISA